MTKTGQTTVNRLAILIAVLLPACSADDGHDSETGRERATRHVVSNLVANTQADTTWERKIAPDEVTITQIHTADLQRHWLSQPIIFTGIIENISYIQGERYRVLLKRSVLHKPMTIRANLKLELECSHEIVDPVLKRTRSEPLQIEDNVAAVANVKDITRHDDGELTYIGHGQCLELEYIDREWRNRDVTTSGETS